MMLFKGLVFSAISLLLLNTGFCDHPLKEYSCDEANCKISFPMPPQHLKQQASFFESNHSYVYDVYISSTDMQTFYYLFATKLPLEANRDLNKKALEGFLSGLLHSSNNKLLSSKLNEDENLSLDFFIESENRFFKGRAFIIGNRFFLIAMDSVEKDLNEKFQSFIQSFSLLDQ